MPIRGFPTQNIVACFTEPNQSGAIDNFDAPRNAPAKNPELHLSRIVFHSSFFQYEVAAGPVNVAITHAALAGKTTTWSLPAGGTWGPTPTPNSIVMTTYGDTRETNIILYTHNLGYIPKFMVSLAGRRLPDGYMVQLMSNGNYRRVSIWADATRIYLRESAVSSDAALTAVTLTYRVIVFRTRTPAPSDPLFGKPGSALIIAKGIINSLRKYLRRTGAGDSPFALNLGRTIDIKNGGSRTMSGGIVVSEPRYNGSMTAPAYKSVGVD